MIPQRNISLIANKLVTAGGRRIPEAVIERDYVLAWLRRLWAGRLARQMSHLPPFDDVFREVMRAVRAADLPKASG